MINTRGFTLAEMMIVLVIALILMTMSVPVFKVSTQTVQKIEQKLALYEAARNLLDFMEAETRLAACNERGGHWSLKSIAYPDNDPFTAPSTTLPAAPNAGDLQNAEYRLSRRASDVLDYCLIDPSGARDLDSGFMPFGGSKLYPLAYPGTYTASNGGNVGSVPGFYPDSWRASLRTSLSYQSCLDHDTQYSAVTSNRYSRDEQLNDVSLIESEFIFRSIGSQVEVNAQSTAAPAGYYYRYYDEIPDALGPGKETRVPPSPKDGFVCIQNERKITGIRLMDLSIDYWDESQQKFQHAPDGTAIYFWPPPKAIRITITVCDRLKRGILTLSRIVQIPTATGSGVVANTNDSDYYVASATKTSVYNRTKLLNALPGVYNGDCQDFSVGTAAVPQVSSETDVLQDNPKNTTYKPYGF